jgi:hypothetical protein
MPSAGLEPTIKETKQPQIYTVYRAATRISNYGYYYYYYHHHHQQDLTAKAMKALGREYRSYSFSTSALDGG